MEGLVVSHAAEKMSQTKTEEERPWRSWRSLMGAVLWRRLSKNRWECVRWRMGGKMETRRVNSTLKTGEK